MEVKVIVKIKRYIYFTNKTFEPVSLKGISRREEHKGKNEKSDIPHTREGGMPTPIKSI